MSSTLSPSRSGRRRRPLANLSKAVSARVRDWARARQGDDGPTATLKSRRIYILPTGVGLTFAIVVFVMLLGAMNYNSSLAFVLTFTLAAVGLVAMHHGHRNLTGLTVRFAGAEPVFAGQPAEFRINLGNPSRSARWDLFAYLDQGRSDSVDLTPGADDDVILSVATHGRGWLTLDRYGVSSEHPLALFRIWTWVHAAPRCLVWPAPADDPPPLPAASGAGGTRGAAESGDDDFAGLRDFQPGDPPRQIAWRAYARTDELSSKRFAGSPAGPAVLRLADVPAAAVEEALSILTAWVLTAHTAERVYGLDLGAVVIAPASGTAHRNRCLQALALHGLPG